MSEGGRCKIGKNCLGIDSHALIGTCAMFSVRQSLQPGKSSVVDCFSNIVAKVETAVIAASQDQHELTRTLFCLRQFQLRYLAFEKIGVDEGSFVSEVLSTSTKMFREVLVSLSFQQVCLGLRNGIPKFRLSFMNVVDGREVQILLMPAEKCLPRPNIAV